jgi:hypothetical protein
MVPFPVYVRDDAKDVMSFASFEVMQAYLEPIDVENHEFKAWDAEGCLLELSVGEPKSEWLKISQSGRTLSQGEFAEIKSKAVPYREPEPPLKSLGRKFGIVRG